MSWSLTIDDLPNYPGPSLDDFERIARDNVSCVDDMLAAMSLASQRGLASCVLTGGRTPTPTSDDEIIDISIRGMAVAQELRTAILDALKSGPDDSTTLWDVEHGILRGENEPDGGTDQLPYENGGG